MLLILCSFFGGLCLCS